MFTVTIIGAGFSGTMLAIQLLQKNHDIPLRIRILEKSLSLGRGIAFSTDKDYHLLNVIAHKMSAYPDDPDHFVNWLKEEKISLSPSGYMPRKIYGNYIHDQLKKTLQKSDPTKTKVEVVYGEAIDVVYRNGFAEVILSNGRALKSDKVVFSIGNFPPSAISKIPDEVRAAGKVCNDPWACENFTRFKENDTLVVIGSGLTMIDTCTTFFKNNFKGKIVSISTHGYLPAVHEKTKSYPAFYDEVRHTYSALQLFKKVRKHIALAAQQKLDWRSVIDSLRPYTQKIWIQLPRAEKNNFLKYLNRIWSISRHRIPPEYHETINTLLRTNQLTILSGKVMRFIVAGEKIEIEYKTHGKSEIKKIKADFIINCTGPQQNYTRIETPLIKNLLKRGVIKPGPLNLGIDAFPDGRIITPIAQDVFYTLGPPLVGVLLETTAVPEIREQAKNLAAKLIYDFKKLTERV